MNVVVVESPAKAKTINKYLGPDYKVLASYGHIRDLPSKRVQADEIWSFVGAKQRNVPEEKRSEYGDRPATPVVYRSTSVSHLWAI